MVQPGNFPKRPEQITDFVRACGAGTAEADLWRTAWERLQWAASPLNQSSPGAEPSAADQFRARPPHDVQLDLHSGLVERSQRLACKVSAELLELTSHQQLRSAGGIFPTETHTVLEALGETEEALQRALELVQRVRGFQEPALRIA
jgi:hypothetical protein